MRFAAFGIGIAAGACWLGGAILLSPNWTIGYLLALPIGGISWGLALAAMYWPEYQVTRHAQISQMERYISQTEGYKLEAQKLRYERENYLPKPTGTPIIIGAEKNDTQDGKERSDAWRAFWIEACTLSETWGGGIGWRSAFERVLSHPDDWRECIREPWVDMGMAHRVTFGTNISAAWRPDWTPQRAAEHIRMRPELPLPQGRALPPSWKRETVNTNNSVETGVHGPQQTKHTGKTGPLGAGA